MLMEQRGNRCRSTGAREVKGSLSRMDSWSGMRRWDLGDGWVSILLTERDTEANGIVCDWYHNVPQLFYLYKYMKPSLPSSCSQVDLTLEYS